MPLHKGAQPGSKEFGKNIATEIEAGKPAKQAEAIAYATAKDGLREAKDAAMSLLPADAKLDRALAIADAMTAQQADRVALRSEMKGHPRKDAFGITKLTSQQVRDLEHLEDIAKGDWMRPVDRDRLLRLRKLKKHYEGLASRKDAEAEPLSREQMEEQAEALRERIQSAREAIEERSIEDMEADLADLEAKLGAEGDDEDEADSKPDGAKLDAILNKMDSMKGKK